MNNRIESPTMRRRTMLGAAGGLSGLSLATTTAAQTVGSSIAVRQAWAHADGRVKLMPNAHLPGSAEDILAIHQIFARYGIAYDEGQNDVLRSLFTDDAVVEVAEASGTPFQRLAGIEHIAANFAETFRQQGDQRRHCITNVTVEAIGGDEAVALAYGIVLVNGLEIGAAVIYDTRLRKVDGLWKFTMFFIGMDAYAGVKPKVESSPQ